MLNVIFRIEAVNGHRILIPSHFPYDRGDMVDVVEFSDKKKVHNFIRRQQDVGSPAISLSSISLLNTVGT